LKVIALDGKEEKLAVVKRYLHAFSRLLPNLREMVVKSSSQKP
jgi:hypothetical protein